MTTQLKTAELNRIKAILLATIDYTIEKIAGSFVADGHDSQVALYMLMKKEVEKYYQLRRLDMLTKRLAMHTSGAVFRREIELAKYIKDTTGYDYDLFEGINANIEKIIEQKKITHASEMTDASVMARFFRETGTEPEKMQLLEQLINAYAAQQMYSLTGQTNVSSHTEHNEATGTTTVYVSDGAGSSKPIWSPDRKRKITVTQYGTKRNKQACTSIHLYFEKAGDCIFLSPGVNTGMKVYWKDNQTLVIHINQANPARIQCKEVSSFGDKVKIEYIKN